jgi:3-oxoacyl-[acyl-carrier-protein] synthase II
MGEGAGVVVVERLERALERGATVYGEIVGYGASDDAYHMAQPIEDGSGAVAAMRAALADARLAPEAVDYINAHGTGTPVGDPVETRAVKAVFGDHAYRLAMSSTKSVTGHMLAAAGAVEAIFCLLAMRDQVLPPTMNLRTPDPDCDLDYVANQARPASVRVAMSNSFGLGGYNASLLLRKVG